MNSFFNINRSVHIGFFLLSFVWLFFIALFTDLVWQNEWLMQHIFRPIDDLSSLLIAGLLLGLPTLALLINLNSVLRGKIYLSRGIIRLGLQIELNFFNWLIIFASVLAMGMVLVIALAKKGLLWLGDFEVAVFHIIRFLQQIS
jgi:hypothetical protein